MSDVNPHRWNYMDPRMRGQRGDQSRGDRDSLADARIGDREFTRAYCQVEGWYVQPLPDKVGGGPDYLPVYPHPPRKNGGES